MLNMCQMFIWTNSMWPSHHSMWPSHHDHHGLAIVGSHEFMQWYCDFDAAIQRSAALIRINSGCSAEISRPIQATAELIRLYYRVRIYSGTNADISGKWVGYNTTQDADHDDFAMMLNWRPIKLAIMILDRWINKWRPWSTARILKHIPKVWPLLLSAFTILY